MNFEPHAKIQDFRDLTTWKEGHKLVLAIYINTREFPKDELFGLTSQMRRASVSITSNIAEGFGRQGYKERIQFFYLAQGSLIELKNQIIISHEVGYIDTVTYNALMEQANTTHQLLQGLIGKSKSFITHDS